ncbi:MAG: DUF1007 family protein [Sulfurospirillum sp.]|nr:DUF1007 family protein [Sulfurospirillum sp.]
MRVFFISLFLHGILFAHPHSFIDMFVTVVGEKSAQRLDVVWLFDDMTSASFLCDFDANKNGQFEKNEIADFKKSVFNNLKQYAYYTHLNVNGKKVKTEPYALDIHQEDKRFSLRFSVNLEPFTGKKKVIGFWDEELYCALSLEKEHIHSSVKYALKEVSNVYYYGYAMEIE